jgi:hypothetical protein
VQKRSGFDSLAKQDAFVTVNLPLAPCWPTQPCAIKYCCKARQMIRLRWEYRPTVTQANLWGEETSRSEMNGISQLIHALTQWLFTINNNNLHPAILHPASLIPLETASLRDGRAVAFLIQSPYPLPACHATPSFVRRYDQGGRRPASHPIMRQDRVIKARTRREGASASGRNHYVYRNTTSIIQ